MDKKLQQRVITRASNCCEYCLTPQECEDLPAEIDHIIPEVHGGRTTASNLALSCFWCNRYKGTNLAGIDPRTTRQTRLFHPRRHRWSFHFLWDGAILQGKTAIGRTTVRVLRINSLLRLRLREQLLAEGVFHRRQER